MQSPCLDLASDHVEHSHDGRLPGEVEVGLLSLSETGEVACGDLAGQVTDYTSK